jgi:hypothetical protein
MRKLLLATAALLALSSGANADVIKLFSGGSGYTGPFSGAGTVYNTIITTPGVLQSCANGGACNVELISTPQTYGSGVDGLTASASGGTGFKVWDDTSPNFGGVGVGTGDTTGSDNNDNINGTNVLTLVFNSSVTLKGVATLFDPAHGPFGGNPLTDSFLLNGNPVSFANANNQLLALTGTTFTFQENGSNAAFYVSGLSFTPGVPEPSTWAMMLLGFVGLGFAFRQSRRKVSLA